MDHAKVNWKKRYQSGETPQRGDIVKRIATEYHWQAVQTGEVRRVSTANGKALCEVTFRTASSGNVRTMVDAEDLVLMRRHAPEYALDYA